MTANFRTIELTSPPPATRASLLPGAIRAWPDRIVFPVLLGALLLLYLLLQNPYWVPAGDSELYTAAARNMARGDGYTFNGQPIAIIPPGWSWLMSLVMRVSPYFLPLKLLTMTCMIGALACAYWIVRRFVSPIQAAGVILLTAILSHVYQATYWLISESSFCLVSTAAVLVAMQIAEGRKHWWRVLLLLALCMGAVAIRWAGVLGMMIVIAALLDRQWRPRLDITWIAAVLVIVVTMGAFLGWRRALHGTPQQVAAQSDAVTGTGEDIGTVPVTDVSAPMTSGEANQSAKSYQLFPTGSYADRLLNWGRWFSYLYWQPFRAAAADPRLLKLATAVGWLIIALLGVVVVVGVTQKRWIWLATGVYAGALALGWTNVNARYYMPIAFLLTLGIFLSTDQLVAWLRRSKLRYAIYGGFIVFVSSVAVCNAALYAVEMSIARSDRFYAKYETGLNMSLISACQYLTALPQPPHDREVAVSQSYTNLGRSKASPFGLRATVLLTARQVITPRMKDSQIPPLAPGNRPKGVRTWLKSKGVKYYLYQPEISPWRVWHFRMGWFEKMQTGKTAEKDTAGWQLYRVDDDRVTPIALPRKCDPVTRIPGL
jgi:hypothetical protein